jgi:hypothetical protein
MAGESSTQGRPSHAASATSYSTTKKNNRKNHNRHSWRNWHNHGARCAVRGGRCAVRGARCAVVATVRNECAYYTILYLDIATIRIFSD